MLSNNLLHKKVFDKFLIDIYCSFNEDFDKFYLFYLMYTIFLYEIKDKTFNFIYLTVKIMLLKNRKQILFQYDIYCLLWRRSKRRKEENKGKKKEEKVRKRKN